LALRAGYQSISSKNRRNSILGHRMLFHGYLKKGIVYVPTVVHLQTGAYVDVEPVAVVPAANTDALRRAFSEAIDRKNAVVPAPQKNKWPPPVLLKHAGVKSWSAFARGASVWSIEESNCDYQIVGYRTHAKGYWEQDPEQVTKFPLGSTVDVVIDRMIAILQDVARSPG
jgi:hypothetical protein